jgi:hypothetical protein
VSKPGGRGLRGLEGEGACRVGAGAGRGRRGAAQAWAASASGKTLRRGGGARTDEAVAERLARFEVAHDVAGRHGAAVPLGGVSRGKRARAWARAPTRARRLAPGPAPLTPSTPPNAPASPPPAEDVLEVVLRGGPITQTSPPPTPHPTPHPLTPHLLKMISRSSSVVTGLSLHTNSMLAGGAASASGRSPIISSTTARDLASAQGGWGGVGWGGVGGGVGRAGREGLQRARVVAAAARRRPRGDEPGEAQARALPPLCIHSRRPLSPPCTPHLACASPSQSPPPAACPPPAPSHPPDGRPAGAGKSQAGTHAWSVSQRCGKAEFRLGPGLRRDAALQQASRLHAPGRPHVLELGLGRGVRDVLLQARGVVEGVLQHVGVPNATRAGGGEGVRAGPGRGSARAGAVCCGGGAQPATPRWCQPPRSCTAAVSPAGGGTAAADAAPDVLVGPPRVVNERVADRLQHLEALRDGPKYGLLLVEARRLVAQGYVELRGRRRVCGWLGGFGGSVGCRRRGGLGAVSRHPERKRDLAGPPAAARTCDALRFLPPLAMPTSPRRVCLRVGLISSSKKRACSPHRMLVRGGGGGGRRGWGRGEAGTWRRRPLPCWSQCVAALVQAFWPWPPRRGAIVPGSAAPRPLGAPFALLQRTPKSSRRRAPCPWGRPSAR